MKSVSMQKRKKSVFNFDEFAKEIQAKFKKHKITKKDVKDAIKWARNN